jgi:hypothetical protein
LPARSARSGRRLSARKSDGRPDQDLIDSIEARSTVEYSTLIDQPMGYLRVGPSQQTIAFEISSTDEKAHVVLDGDLCP